MCSCRSRIWVRPDVNKREACRCVQWCWDIQAGLLQGVWTSNLYQFSLCIERLPAKLSAFIDMLKSSKPMYVGYVLLLVATACVCVRTVSLGSVLGVLLLLMIIMAVCVYKPLSRRWKVEIKTQKQTCSPTGFQAPGNHRHHHYDRTRLSCQQASLKTTSLHQSTWTGVSFVLKSGYLKTHCVLEWVRNVSYDP